MALKSSLPQDTLKKLELDLLKRESNSDYEFRFL